ncbi:MAG: hypothetical protein KGL44_05655 [Sphingomonadales bacterium]|nr:hypothetical protein [Sphingomonadales bacterium]
MPGTVWTGSRSSDFQAVFMRKRLRNAFLLFLLTGLVAFWYLLRENSPGQFEPKQLDIAELRSLAGSIPGQAPQGLSAGLIAIHKVPSDLISPGSGMQRRIYGIMPFRLEVPGKPPILIDGGISRRLARQLGMSWYGDAGQKKFVQTAQRASLILATNERPEHLQGLLELAGEQSVIKQLRLNPGQLPSARLAAKLHWPTQPFVPAELSTGKPQAVAPGVVVIPAPGVTPGSQMIYVREAGGRELLFAGDIAQFADNAIHQRARSHLLDLYGDAENRAEVQAWLAAIGRLTAQAPNLVVVPAHDKLWLLDSGARPNLIDWPDDVPE